jgi:hypothetical protein
MQVASCKVGAKRRKFSMSNQIAAKLTILNEIMREPFEFSGQIYNQIDSNEHERARSSILLCLPGRSLGFMGISKENTIM